MVEKTSTRNPEYVYLRGFYFNGTDSEFQVKRALGESNDLNANIHMMTYIFVIRFYVMVLNNNG